MIKTISLLTILSLFTCSLFGITITQEPYLSDFTTNSIDINWQTDALGTTELKWGYTPELEQENLVVSESKTEHFLQLTGLSPATLVYLLPYSVNAGDTVKAAKQLIAMTVSESSGDIKVYFNATVDNSKAISEDAVQLDDLIADTLVNYINRAQKTIDLAIYNMDTYSSSKITTALNNAYNRGVTVRVVYNESTTNSGVAGLNASIGKIKSPSGEEYGIMHNKFLVFDVASIDSAIVWTGSTNLTSQQMNTDPNNVIIIQDQSLAKAYTMEFNEMFGSESESPNLSKAKFGPDKKDNTPHEFLIADRYVESYFSPSDNAHQKIIDVINSANEELQIASMLITRQDIANAIRDIKNTGVTTQLIMDDIDNYTQDNILVTALGGDFRVMGESGIMHHKYMIVDQGSLDSDPQVLTGCHNWSTSARDRNDENTLVVHDQNIANIYYQEFANRFNNGEKVAEKPDCLADTAVYLKDDNTPITINILANDTIVGDYDISIIEGTELGIIELNIDNTISYRPKIGFSEGVDSFRYEVCSSIYPGLCNNALVTVNVGEQGGTSILTNSTAVASVFPSVSTGNFSLTSTHNKLTVKIINASGQLVYDNDIMKDKENVQAYSIDLSTESPGIYYLMAIGENGDYYTTSLIIQ